MAKDYFKVNVDDAKSLSKRYLLWLYKTTRDELDKIDRKFTQLEIDNQIYKRFKSAMKGLKARATEGFSPFLQEWQEYIFSKESDAQKLKYKENGEPDYAYLFLKLKLGAIEHITESRFGKKELLLFKKLYEESAIKRILEDVSGKR